MKTISIECELFINWLKIIRYSAKIKGGCEKNEE